MSPQRHKFLSAIFPPRFVIFILSVFFIGLTIFGLTRLLFLLSFSSQWIGVASTEIFIAFLVGVRFDAMVLSVIMLPIILVLPWLRLGSNISRRIATAYLTPCYSFLIIAGLADIRFYSYFDSHLNFLAVEYLDEGATAWNLIFADPRFVSFIAVWIFATLILWSIISRLHNRIGATAGQDSAWRKIIWSLVLMLLVVAGGRGRTGTSGLNWSIAFTGENRFINQLPLNGPYTLGQSLYEKDHDPRLIYRSDDRRGYSLVNFSDGLDHVQGMLKQVGDEWLEPESSILRLTRQEELTIGYRPNIVLVLMESWSAEHTGCLGSEHDLTPNFDKLAAQGILFTDFYATGFRSNYGLGGLLCAFPSMPGRAIMKRYDAAHPFITLPEILHERGYVNAFIYGGDPAFDNVEGFLTAKGVDLFYADTHFGKELYFSDWGIPDHVLFEKTMPLIDSLPRPFFTTIFTLSHHEPFDLPDSSKRRFDGNDITSKVYNSQIYADHALGQFVREFESYPVSDSTIFVFVSDHCDYRSGQNHANLFNFQIPLLFYAPEIIGTEPRLVSKTGGQTDLIPTLMHLLGDDYTHASWGRDLLRLNDDETGWATVNVFNLIGMITSRYLYAEGARIPTVLYDRADLRPDTKGVDIGPQAVAERTRLQNDLRIYLQIADQMSTPEAR